MFSSDSEGAPSLHFTVEVQVSHPGQLHGVHLCRCTGPHIQQVPMLVLMLCLHCLEILSFYTRLPHFHLALDPANTGAGPGSHPLKRKTTKREPGLGALVRKRPSARPKVCRPSLLDGRGVRLQLGTRFTRLSDVGSFWAEPSSAIACCNVSAAGIGP